MVNLCALIAKKQYGKLKHALIEKQNPNTVHNNAYPIQIACLENDLHAVHILLHNQERKGVPTDPTLCTPCTSIRDDYWPAIVYAIWHENITMIDMLVAHGVDLGLPMFPPKFGQKAPLHWIVLHSTPAILTHCLTRHVSKNDAATIDALIHLCTTASKQAHLDALHQWIQKM